MSEDQRRQRKSPNITAKKKVMDLVARRDHSETELRQKLQHHLSDAENPDSAIEDALDFAKANNWISDPEALAARQAQILHQRNKGIEYINAYLESKGLPPVATDRELELEKALGIIKNKYEENHQFDSAEKAKIGRLLTSRGFDSETVRKVLYEKL